MSTQQDQDQDRADPQAPVAVVGATGQQGGATTRALLAAGVPVRGLTRDPSSDGGRALAEAGAEPVAVELDDPASIRRAFDGARGVFAMTTFAGPKGTQGEVEQGRRIAEAAREAGVEHVVYSSVGGAERATGIPHFESKRRVEERFLELEVPVTFVRPVFFMDNLLARPPQVEDGALVLRQPLPGGVKLQMVAVEDIGRVAAAALAQPGRPELAAGAVEIGGDERTGEEIAEAFGTHTGLPARYEALGLDALGDDEDLKAMYAWFDSGDAYRADRGATAALAGGSAQDLPAFLRASGWTPQDAG